MSTISITKSRQPKSAKLQTKLFENTDNWVKPLNILLCESKSRSVPNLCNTFNDQLLQYFKHNLDKGVLLITNSQSDKTAPARRDMQ